MPQRIGPLDLEELEELLEIYNRRSVSGEQKLERTLKLVRMLKAAVLAEKAGTPPST